MKKGNGVEGVGKVECHEDGPGALSPIVEASTYLVVYLVYFQNTNNNKKWCKENA